MEKIYVTNVFKDTPIESDNKTIKKSIQKLLIELGITGVSDVENTKPVIYLKDYLYSKLYDRFVYIESIYFLEVKKNPLGIIEITYEGR